MISLESVVRIAKGLAIADVEALAKFVKELEPSENLKSIVGEIVEVGTYQGGTAMVMAAAAPGRMVTTIDTFEGLPKPGEFDVHKEGEMFASLARVTGNVKHFKNINLFKADVRNFKAWEKSIALLFLDCDLYESYRAALRVFWPHVSIGGYAILEDYRAGDCPGATKAVDEFFRPGMVHQHLGFWCARKT